MKVEIKIDESCAEPKIVILTDRVADEISEIVKRLSLDQPPMLVGFKDGQAAMLELSQIYRVYASEGRVYAEAESGAYLLRLRLYEAEQRLAGPHRAYKPRRGGVKYASRRYVSKIRQLLGI